MSRPTLALVGDSLVANGKWADLLPDHETIVLGSDNLASEDLLELLAPLSETSPHTIALHVGGSERDRRRPVEHIVRNAQLFMVSARRELPGARMLVVSIVADAKSVTWAADANRHLRQFAPSVNAHYLDLWAALAIEGELRADLASVGGALNAAGYDAVAAELRPALDRVGDSPPMSLPIPIIRSLSN